MNLWGWGCVEWHGVWEWQTKPIYYNYNFTWQFGIWTLTKSTSVVTVATLRFLHIGIGLIQKNAPRNAENLASNRIIRISIYFIKKTCFFFYLVHLKVIARWPVDVGILGVKQAQGDVILLSNYVASVSRPHSVNSMTLTTDDTKTNRLKEKKNQMRSSARAKEDCFGLNLPGQGANWCTEGWWVLGSPWTIGICIRVGGWVSQVRSDRKERIKSVNVRRNLIL